MLNIFIAFVWLINGLFCKVINLVPRHTEIVAHFLGDEQARLFTILIGLGETVLAIWILSGNWNKPTAILQLILVFAMNILEFLLVPDMLLWGRFNSIFALLFAIFIYYHAFIQKPRETVTPTNA
jgi:hypothetical protein